MTMTVYKSTDVSAPTLTNTNGSLINVLDKCLVAGYGAKAGAGWTKPFTGTNLAAFRQGAGGNNRYLRVLDNGFSTGNAALRRVLIRGYENMTAISTGTNAFPTTTQVSGNGMTASYLQITSTVTPTTWTIYATSNYFLFHVELFDDAAGTVYNSLFGFGRFESLKVGDVYNDVIFGGGNDASGQDYAGQYNTANQQMYVSRSDTGSVGAVDAMIRGVFGSTYIGSGNQPDYPYPDRINNSLKMARVSIWCSGYKRGYLTGIWDVAHAPADVGPNKTTWSGAGSGLLSGKEFVYVAQLAPNVAGGAWPAIETSNTWS